LDLNLSGHGLLFCVWFRLELSLVGLIFRLGLSVDVGVGMVDLGFVWLEVELKRYRKKREKSRENIFSRYLVGGRRGKKIDRT